MNQNDIDTILALRLLIARAGNKDSLGWWDDDSLSSYAEYVLQRTFPVAPKAAGRRLALEAAFCRHQASVPEDSQSVHLYRLTADNRDYAAVRFHELSSIDVPEEPIRSKAELREHLLQLIGHELPYKVGRHDPADALEIEVTSTPQEIDPVVHRAQTLAWAYLEAGDGRALLPYCIDK